ncbi:hypothetical protein [Candidatus Nitrospira nitrosa]|nr:hypothetical protein [Candidatus Nitrospira nitrosa]
MNGLLAIGNIVERQTDITIKELDEGAKKFNSFYFQDRLHFAVGCAFNVVEVQQRLHTSKSTRPSNLSM